jgi:hypothetical protein
LVTESHRAAHTVKSVRVLVLGAALTAVALSGCSSSNKGGSAFPGLGASTGSTGASTAPATATATASSGAGVGASASASAGSGSAAGSSSVATSAWIDPSAIPLYSKYKWASPASVAKSAKSPVLSAVQDCQLSLSSSDKSELGAFAGAQADLSPTTGGTGGQDDWSAQETILATNDTSSGDIQGIYSLYTDLVSALAGCSSTASGAKVTIVSNQGPAYAATITVPTSTGSTLTWHEYLAAPYGYLIELSVWVAPYSGDQPSASWDGSSASGVLSAMQSGPCALTKLC